MPNTNRSTGPRTEEGKRRSSLNALKHGLHANAPQTMQLIAERTGADFHTILDDMRRQFRPVDALEEQLVRRIARCVWRLAVSENMEERVMGRRPSALRPGASLEKVMKYERLVDIHLHRAIAALERKKESRNKSNAQNELPSTLKPSVSSFLQNPEIKRKE